MSDKEVSIFVLTLIFSLILLGVNENLDGFATLIRTVEICDSFLSTLLGLKLDITLTSTVTAGESFEFAWLDVSVFLEKSLQLLLIHILWKVSHKAIGFAIKIAILLFVEDDLLAINNSIILLRQASWSFLLIVEIQVSETLGFACFSVEHDLCAGKFIALALEVLVQVKIEGLVTEVTNVKSDKVAILSLLVRLICSSLHL
jgi:hypothetical protein